MASVLPPTETDAVRTAAAPLWLAEGELAAEAAVMPPAAATAARAMPEMMILGGRMVRSCWYSLPTLLIRIVEARGSSARRQVTGEAVAAERDRDGGRERLPGG